MIDLSRVSFAGLLPPNLKDDPDAIAAAYALDGHFHTFCTDMYKEIVFSNIGALDDATLNRLAYDMHIDYYDEALPTENRRALVQNNLAVHARKGTPWSLEQVLSDAFGNGRIEEWFEYGGEPYFFRIRVRPDQTITEQKEMDILSAIDGMKNVRSWLERIVFEYVRSTQIYVGAAALVETKVTAGPRAMKPIPLIRMYAGTAALQQTRIAIRPSNPAVVLESRSGMYAAAVAVQDTRLVIRPDGAQAL